MWDVSSPTLWSLLVLRQLVRGCCLPVLKHQPCRGSFLPAQELRCAGGASAAQGVPGAAAAFFSLLTTCGPQVRMRLTECAHLSATRASLAQLARA